MTDASRVRVVVLDYNGGDLTIECLRHVLATEWPADRLDVVLVDNASVDSIVERVGRELPRVRVIRNPANLGFAAGCNVALRDLDGVDYVALVNNDVSVEPGWLAPLVRTLESDPAAGAAGPKIRFASPFLELEITAETHRRGRGDDRALGVRLSGARVLGIDVEPQLVHGFWGHEPADVGPGEWTAARAIARVPVPAEPTVATSAVLRLSSEWPTTVTITSGSSRTQLAVGVEPAWYPVALDGAPFEVIANAGSVLTPDGYGADRGYLERDDGQYEHEEDVFAWCGAAVLLSRRYLDDVGLFDERLFLYYEDLELAWRGRERGWRSRYVPRSVVRHVHSATAVAGSSLARYYNERNRLVTLTRHGTPTALARAAARHLAVTASYARRDVVSPLLHRQPPRPAIVADRLRAFGGWLRLAPAMLSERRGGGPR